MKAAPDASDSLRRWRVYRSRSRNAAPSSLVQAREIQGVVLFGILGATATTVIQYQDQSALPLDAPIGYNPGIFTIYGRGAS